MSAVSNFFSRDNILKRQPRTRTRKLPERGLQSIPELSEDECLQPPQPIAGPSRSVSPKAERRRAQIKPDDVRLAKQLVDGCPSPDLIDVDDIFSSIVPPRPAPLPPTSSSSSPTPSPVSESFSVLLEDMNVSFRFPHPPLPTPSTYRFTRDLCSSPTPSLTDGYSSPETYCAPLPKTPGSSDEGYTKPRKVIPRRVSIRPLVIVKNSSKHQQVAYQSSDDEESDLENPTDWYAREFSQILSLHSSVPECKPLPPARPDSMHCTHHKKESKPLPPTPRSGTMPSAQLDPAFPRRRRSTASFQIPTRPPPPPPMRPPPRVSVPTDFHFDIELEQGGVDPDDSFESFVITTDSDFSASPSSLEFNFDVEVDQPMRLPLSLPVSPIDLESGLQALRREEERERVLRSRWSSSTLSSQVEQDASVASKLRHYFSSPQKRGHKAKSASTSGLFSPPPTSASKRFFVPSTPMFEGRAQVKRKGSRSSNCSSASDMSHDSASSSGLRRKPIPVEMFLRASVA